jgi:hypothetical protein
MNYDLLYGQFMDVNDNNRQQKIEIPPKQRDRNIESPPFEYSPTDAKSRSNYYGSADNGQSKLTWKDNKLSPPHNNNDVLMIDYGQQQQQLSNRQLSDQYEA